MALLWLLILAFVGASSAFSSLLEVYPSVVQVETVSLTGWAVWTQTCTGSILNNRNILTTASCVIEPYFKPSDIRIRAGANYRGTGGIIHNVEIAIPSPSTNIANVTGWSDDVAVVRLTSFLTYSNVIGQAIIVGPGSVIPAGLPLTQLGWQYRNDTALSEVSIVTINRSNCGLTPNDTQSLCSSSSPVLDNVNPGSPLLYFGINVGLISGVNFIRNSTDSLVSADIGSYTNWIISVAV